MIRSLALIIFAFGSVLPLGAAENWSQWRGPDANGVAEGAKPPMTWSEKENIRWKAEIPGHGLSTPIVWGDLVLVQTAVNVNPEAGKDKEGEEARERGGEGRNRERGDRRRGPGGRRGGRGMRRDAPSDVHKFSIIAIDRRSGKTVWERTLREEVPHEGSHRDGSLAPASPLTDGEHIFAYFGSRGLYCLTMDGKTVWEKDLGDMKTRNGFGEGSSPALLGDTLIVNWDHEGDSFIVALDKRTGKEKWRRERDEASSWSTPLIVREKGKPIVIVNGSKRVRGYDLATGKDVWECGGLGSNCAASPVADKGVVYAMSGHRNPALLAIRYEGANGDLTGSKSVLWKLDKDTPYVPSPLLYGDMLYFLKKNNGILSCYDAREGKPYFNTRVDEIEGVYASPVGAADRVYIAGRNGATCVLKRGKEYKVLAVNKLDDEFSASPAIVGNEIFLRGRNHLYCISEE